jgi:nitrile hydratase
VFHAEWERRAFALTLAMARPGGWNIDMGRFAREDRQPREYLSMSYYQIWFAALESMLKERGLVSEDEIAAGRSLHPPKPVKRVLSPADVLKVLHRGGPTERETDTQAAFKPGDQVRAKNINPRMHTRLPRYVRGRIGTVERVIGFHVFPDSNAQGGGENPQWLYCVRFEGRELWGTDADPTVKVSVDAWESYLEPA